MTLDHRRLKGHSELMHMRISYHFLAGLADLYIATHARETGSEKYIRNIPYQKSESFRLRDTS